MNGIRYVPMINGVEYSWADISIAVNGVVLTGVTEINYGEKQTINNIYGAGQHPIGRGYGRIEPSASITLLRSTVEALRSSSDTGRLMDIAPFTIIVCYIPLNGGVIVKHIIRGCQFTEDSISYSEGDTHKTTALPLIVSSIQWNAKNDVYAKA